MYQLLINQLLLQAASCGASMLNCLSMPPSSLHRRTHTEAEAISCATGSW